MWSQAVHIDWTFFFVLTICSNENGRISERGRERGKEKIEKIKRASERERESVCVCVSVCKIFREEGQMGGKWWQEQKFFSVFTFIFIAPWIGVLFLKVNLSLCRCNQKIQCFGINPCKRALLVLLNKGDTVLSNTQCYRYCIFVYTCTLTCI